MLQHQDEVEESGDDDNEGLVGGGGSRGEGGGGRGGGEEEEKPRPSSFSTCRPVIHKHQKEMEKIYELEDKKDDKEKRGTREENEEEEEEEGEEEEKEEEEKEEEEALASLRAIFPSLPPDVLKSILAQHSGTPVPPSLPPSFFPSPAPSLHVNCPYSRSFLGSLSSHLPPSPSHIFLPPSPPPSLPSFQGNADAAAYDLVGGSPPSFSSSPSCSSFSSDTSYHCTAGRWVGGEGGREGEWEGGEMEA